MINLKLAQKEPELLKKALEERHSALDVENFLELDGQRRQLLAQVEALSAERNRASANVAAMKRSGEDASHLFEELGRLSDRIRQLNGEVDAIQERERAWLMSVPNIPDASVPPGPDESANVEIERVGEPRVFDFEPAAHDSLGSDLGGLDFLRASRLTGSRFVVLTGWAARMERALVSFFLDRHIVEGYVEVSPPYMVNRETMTGTGQLPKFEEDLFRLASWDYYLIPTAEVPLTNLHAGETLDEEALPLAYCAASPCFRSEAGAAGRDTRGLIRMHQFTKVEMVRFAHPDDSFRQLELMRRQAGELLSALGLPYRVITLCAGDLGFSAAKTYDLEVWLPAQKCYREISSCSNCTDFQARRAGIRYKPKGGKAAFCHTLNGSGLPIGRTMAAIIENGQQADGSVLIPPALSPYMGGLEIIEPVR